MELVAQAQELLQALTQLSKRIDSRKGIEKSRAFGAALFAQAIVGSGNITVFCYNAKIERSCSDGAFGVKYVYCEIV